MRAPEPGGPMSALRRAWGVRTLRIPAIFVMTIALFLLAMTATYSLPQARIAKNLQKSVARLKAEGRYPRPVFDSMTYRLDNFTDALMLDTAITEKGKGPLFSALMGYHGNVVGSDGKADTIAALELSAHEARPLPGQYAYYWHGYQLPLRPALLLLTYGEIRYVNLLCLGMLALIVLLWLQRTAGTLAAAAFFFSLLATGFFIVPLSLQFSSVVYVMLLAVLAVLFIAGQPYESRVDLEIFMVVGMTTAFVDLLTAPLLTLGMPLAVALIVRGRRSPRPDFRGDLFYTARLSAIWAFGYLACWAAKWWIGSAVLKIDVVGLAMSQLLFRTGMGKTGPSVFEAVVRNSQSLFPLASRSAMASVVHGWPIVLVAGIAIVALCVWLFAFNRSPRADIARAASVLFVVPLPYAWFIVANNHSTIHYWFTYRVQAIAVFALAYFALSCIDFGRLADRIRHRPMRPRG